MTESGCLEDLEAASAALQMVRDHGVSISIDDFGTGYSSLAYLHKLPASTLKIDRSFVTRLSEDPHTLHVVRAIMRVAHSLDMQVVAEGIETMDQLEHLRALDCDFGQGYLYAKPIAADLVDALLDASQSLDERSIAAPRDKDHSAS